MTPRHDEANAAHRPRTLLIVLGDQLSPEHPVLATLDPAQDALWMAEVTGESTHVPSHRARTALFLAAMRQFAERRRAAGLTVHYRTLDSAQGPEQEHLGGALEHDLAHLQPQNLCVLQPGERRVQRDLENAAARHGLRLEIREDPHFIDTPEAFGRWAGSRRELRLEHYYRKLRREHDVLMDGEVPAGGAWNFDASNRGSFGRQGPGLIPEPTGFPPDAITRGAIDDVRTHLPHLPGELEAFDWPVTPEQAQAALEDFIRNRLPAFGTWQDAMWTDAPWLYHARISAALNLHLLDPRAAIREAEAAWRDGHAPVEAVEGFIRQILGWREYVRGLYFHFGDDWHAWNALDAREPLPRLYWDADTDMTCLAQAVGQTLRLGYAHHIQRLMVTGLFAQLLGVEPRAIHAWYLGIYVDAVEWVELPNVLGMSQYADGGRMASKPYVATGRYIQRMSNYCRHCRFDPGEATGERACPFTTLYWDFLDRHHERFARHPRTALQWKHVERMEPERLQQIRDRAGELRRRLREGDRL